MFKRNRLIASALVLALILVLAVSSMAFGGKAEGQARSPYGYVSVDENFIAYGTDSVIEAFVPTSSTSPKCLVTLGESGTIAAAGTTVFCGARNVGGQDYLYVHIFFNSSLPAQFDMTMTVFQEGARRYGEAIPNPSPPYP
jgi:hypothetical protein